MIKLEVPYLTAAGAPASDDAISALHAREQLLRGALSVDGHSDVPKRKKPGPTAQFEYDPHEISIAEITLNVNPFERFGNLVEAVMGEYQVTLPCKEGAPGAKKNGEGEWEVELDYRNQAVIMAGFATEEFALQFQENQERAFDESHLDPGDAINPIAGRERDGIMLGGSHPDPTNFVAGMQMMGMDCSGIDPANTYDDPDEPADPPAPGAIVFVEEIPSVFQPHLDKYMRKGKFTPLLDTYLGTLGGNYHKDYKALLASVRNSGGRVVGLDDTSTKIFDQSLMPLEKYQERRAGIMNVVSAEIMGNALADSDDGTPFLALVGAAHVEAHAGGVLGMSQILGVDYACYEDGALALDADGEPRVSNVDLIKRFRPQERQPTPAPVVVPKKLVSEKARWFVKTFISKKD